MASQLQTEQVANAYGRWAPVYDLVFGPVFRQGRRAAIDVAERIGGRILEVGVGTGISLPDYDKANRITGVDISEPMLDKARERVRALHLDHIEQIAVMDAEAMNFPDDSFVGTDTFTYTAATPFGTDTATVTVTVAARELQQQGAIQYSRGSILVTDRAKLESLACECYSAIQARLAGPRLG